MRGILVPVVAIAMFAGCAKSPMGGGGGGQPAPKPSPTAKPGGGGGAATPAPVSVAGNWAVAYKFNPTPPGSDQINYNATGSLTLAQTGMAISGTYTEPGYTAAVTGNLSGRTMSLTIGPATRGSRTTTISDTATLAPNGNSATGSVTVTIREQNRSLQLTGRSTLTRR